MAVGCTLDFRSNSPSSLPPSLLSTQPALTEPSVTLALSLIRHQLDQFNKHLSLVEAILYFLSQLATTARTCAKESVGEEGVERAYTTEQVQNILKFS